MIYIAYDLTLKRPGCALVQAAVGCDSKIANRFHSRTWLTEPTKDMAVYPLDNEDQLAKLVTVTEKHPPNAKSIAQWEALLRRVAKSQRKAT